MAKTDYSTQEILNIVYSGTSLKTEYSTQEVLNAVFSEASGALKINYGSSGIAVTCDDTENFVPIVATQNDVTNNPNAVNVVNTGTGNGIFVDQDGIGIALNIDSEATTQAAFSITSAINGGGADWPFRYAGYILSEGAGGNLFLYRNQNTTTRSILRIHEDGAANVNTVEVLNDGTGNGLLVDQNGNGIALNIDSEATTAAVINCTSVNTQNPYAFSIDALIEEGWRAFTITNTAAQTNSASIFRIYSAQQDTGGQLAYLWENNASATNTILSLNHAGSGKSLFIDQNGNGLALQIDKDCTVNDTRTWAMAIASDNAGTGTALGCGIDMSSFAVDEPLLKVVSDPGNTPGDLTGQLAIDVGGTTYYVYYYTTSTVV